MSIKNISKITKFIRPIASTIAADLKRIDLLKQASAMAYATLLSVVPFIAVTLAIITKAQSYAETELNLIMLFKRFIYKNLSRGTGQEVTLYIDEVLKNINFTNIGISGLLGALVSFTIILTQIENILNRIWMVDKGRNTILRLLYFCLLLIAPTFLISVAMSSLSRLGVEQLTYGGITDSTFTTPYLYDGAGLLFFIFLLKIVPNTFVPMKYAVLGALYISTLLNFAGELFKVFIEAFPAQMMFYGALASLPLFLIWLYLCWVIILSGALLTWRLDQGFKTRETSS